jgi:hypothetical protein
MAPRMGCFCSILWLIFLIFLVWPLALILSFFWIVLQPFEACCPVIRSINRFLERFVTWPQDFGHAIATGQSNCPNP